MRKGHRPVISWGGGRPYFSKRNSRPVRVATVFARFDIVAPGHVWGRWGDANGKSMYMERPGRTPFGFAFELATGDSPSDRIPPGGNGSYVSERNGYFHTSE